VSVAAVALFATRLRLAREALGLSARELSLAAGLSSAYVGHMERGHRELPSIACVAQLAAALHVTPGWLAFGESAPQKRPTTDEEDWASLVNVARPLSAPTR
jgi:transcriptional regulator with XRE-family HTH domain